MKKVIMMFSLIAIMFVLCSCEQGSYTSYSNNTKDEVNHKGKCLEYETKYKLDCGLFVDSENFCKERKYDVCVRWEEDINENN